MKWLSTRFPHVALPVARLLRRPRAWLPVLAWGVLLLLVAWAMRREGTTSATSRVLVGPFGGLAVPLLALGLITAVSDGDLRRGQRSLVAFGGSPRRAALAGLGVAASATALVAALLAVAIVVLTFRPGGPSLLRDTLTSAWIAALGGLTYAAYFGLGACFGARGGGRGVFLIADFLFGGGSGGTAMLMPRAHLRNLLGGAPPLDVPQPYSTVALTVLALTCAALVAVRTRR